MFWTPWRIARKELSNLQAGNSKTDEYPHVQFCALEYSAQETSGVATIILFVLADGEGILRFFVHPDWRTVVHTKDLDYIQSLLLDFTERNELHPEALFTQLSSLGVGPLVTKEVGKSISDHPILSELCSGFLQL